MNAEAADVLKSSVDPGGPPDSCSTPAGSVLVGLDSSMRALADCSTPSEMSLVMMAPEAKRHHPMPSQPHPGSSSQPHQHFGGQLMFSAGLASGAPAAPQHRAIQLTEDQSLIKGWLDSMKAENRQLVQQLRDDSRQQHQDMKRMNDAAWQEVRKGCEQDRVRLGEAEQKVEVVSGRVQRVEDALELVRDQSDRNARCLELVVRGAPLTGNESTTDLCKMIETLGRKINLDLNERTLMTAFAVKQRVIMQPDGRVAPPRDSVIICRFSDAGIRHLFYQRYIERKGFDAMDLGFQASKRIYVSENLTALNARIRGRATQMKREKVINNFSVRDGLIRIRVNERSAYVAVHTLADLDELTRSGELPRPGVRLRNPFAVGEPTHALEAEAVGTSLANIQI